MSHPVLVVMSGHRTSPCPETAVFDPDPSVQIACPITTPSVPPPSNAHIAISDMMLERVEIADARLAFSLAELRLVMTIDASIPMIPMTIKSSINVNPDLCFFIFYGKL
jgi:hypothetical protein